MAYDTTLPTKTQHYDTGMLSSIRANVLAVAMMLDPTDAGAVSTPVAGLRRFNAATGRQQRYSGTAWVDETVNVTGSAATAAKLTTARSISATGDATWTVSFDGSGAVSGVLTLANTGIVAGNYRYVTVDSKGRVISGSNPTTLSGYGITDGFSAAAGGTVTGDVIAQQAGYGGVALRSTATASRTGYLDFRGQNGVRQGLIGYSGSESSTQDAGTLNYWATTHAFTGSVTIGGSPAITQSSGDARYAQLSGAPTFAGLVKARGGGLGLGRISVTTTTGTPSGMSAGDLVLVY